MRTATLWRRTLLYSSVQPCRLTMIGAAVYPSDSAHVGNVITGAIIIDCSVYPARRWLAEAETN
jgi:hypothetical protein